MTKIINALPKLLAVRSTDAISYFAMSLDDSYTEDLDHKKMPTQGWDNRTFSSPYGNSFESCCKHLKSLGYSYDETSSLALGQTVFKLN
ncbi:MAG: hypothetical protein V7K62_09060 [Nostoc sp.]